MTQERVDAFADVTEDHNYIHVDLEARQGLAVRRHDRPRLPERVAAGADLDGPAAGHRRGDERQLRHGQAALPGAAAGRRALPRRGRDHGGHRGQGRHAGEGGVHARSRAIRPSRRWSPSACTGTTDEARREGRGRHRQRARPRPRLRGGAGAAGASVVVNDVDGDAAQRRRARRSAAWPRSARSARPRPPTRWWRARSAEFGRLDVMVTNAGVLRDKVLWKMTDEDFDVVVRHAPARHVHLRARRGGADARAGRGRPDRRRRLARRPVRQLRPDQLRRGQGRHRRVRAHVGAGAGARADHGQRDRPHGVDADDRDDPDLRAARRAATTFPRRGAPGARARRAGGLRAAGRVPGLGRGRRRHRAGDRDRRRPPEPVLASRPRSAFELREGGWTRGGDRGRVGGLRRRSPTASGSRSWTCQ